MGAGIGGLAVALALCRTGWTVAVSERGSTLDQSGAGLSIWPNAVHSLRSLGLGELIDAAPVESPALRRQDGSPIYCLDPKTLERRYGAPLAAVHRGDLLNALGDALGRDAIRFGAAVEAVDPRGEVRLERGGTLAADVVVGADGLRSVTRRAVIGDAEPRQAGIVAFRGVTGHACLEIPAGEWWGEGGVAGLLPLSGARVYWYLGVPSEAAGKDPRPHAAAYASPLPELVAATRAEQVLRHELLDRPPAGSWSAESATLLGDAAHPMLPFVGQGACSALDDAVALGVALSGSDRVPIGLVAYEKQRVRQGARLVRASRRAARVALVRSPPLRAVRNAALARLPLSVRLRQLDGILGRSPSKIACG